jgi:glutamate/tyrosine decarboxylase-like PLP-dependent enzyme
MTGRGSEAKRGSAARPAAAALPRAGLSAAAVLDELEALQSGDVDWKSGRAFSLAYHAGPDVLALATEANARFLSANALNPAAFPSLRKMQADVVAMVAGLLHGGSEAAGFMTSGGTESILLAVEAARSHGRAERGVSAPEMVLPASAHAAFEKAAAYFGVKSVRVPVRDDYRADPAAMRAAIGERTVLVVASAPAYPQGVVDPVAEIAALAAGRDVLCHVDACMGGITLPMLERLGHPVPPFDFRVPGVTSMSVDLHKYGYTAKGASVILHRSRELRRHQTFATGNWLGGAYASSGVLGTRSGGPIAAAWAVMRHLGEDGYLRLTREARAATERLAAGLRATPGVRVLAEPDATLVAFTIEGADVFGVGDALWRRGWVVDQQKPPPSLHCTVNAVHRDAIEPFLGALAASIAEVRASGATAAQKAYGAVE